MISSSLVLKGLYDKLTGNAPLMAIVTGVYNNVSQDSQLPYIRIQVERSVDSATKTEIGLTFDLIVDIWTTYAGDKQALDIADLVREELDQSSLPGVSAQSLSLAFQAYDTVVEPDGKTHHAIMTFQYIETE